MTEDKSKNRKFYEFLDCLTFGRGGERDGLSLLHRQMLPIIIHVAKHQIKQFGVSAILYEREPAKQRAGKDAEANLNISLEIKTRRADTYDFKDFCIEQVSKIDQSIWNGQMWVPLNFPPTPGWYKTCKADAILYQWRLEGDPARFRDAYVIFLKPFRAWFNPLMNSYEIRRPRYATRAGNRSWWTEIQFVPIQDVPYPSACLYHIDRTDSIFRPEHQTILNEWFPNKEL